MKPAAAATPTVAVAAVFGVVVAAATSTDRATVVVVVAAATAAVARRSRPGTTGAQWPGGRHTLNIKQPCRTCNPNPASVCAMHSNLNRAKAVGRITVNIPGVISFKSMHG